MKWRRILIGLVVVLAVAGFAFVWFSGGSGEPTTAVTAPPVITASSPSTTVPAPTTSAPPTGSEQEAPEAVSTTGAVTEPTTTATASTPVSTVPDGPAEASEVVYRIDSASSSVRFEIDEILNGSPKRVVGVTSEVAGEALIDYTDPTASRLGAVVINVRTLETDSSFRDRATRGPILGSARDENEFATFEPTGVEGLPGEITIGETVELVVTGDFTLSGVTRPVVFDIDVVLVDENRIEVTGSATVLRSDFGLQIPSVPGVSDVGDEILLAVDLVAVATDG